MQQYEIHPAAELFPLLTGEEFENFKADIRERGLIEPIWLYGGKLLDGRNRLRACTELGIEPTTREYKGDAPTAFAWSLNGKRRHLDKSQLATIAVNMVPALKEEAARRRDATSKDAPRDEKGHLCPVPRLIEGPAEAGEAVAQAAAMVGVDKSYVYEAKRIKEEDPETFAAIQEGKTTVHAAKEKRKGKKKESNRKPLERRAEEIRALALEGWRASQIAEQLGIGEQQIRNLANKCDIQLPDAAIGKTHKIDPIRVIEATVHGLEGYAQGLQTINGGVHAVPRESAAEWAESLKHSLGAIRKLQKELLEIVNGN